MTDDVIWVPPLAGSSGVCGVKLVCSRGSHVLRPFSLLTAMSSRAGGLYGGIKLSSGVAAPSVPVEDELPTELTTKTSSTTTDIPAPAESVASADPAPAARTTAGTAPTRALRVI